jgi:hypothetical protein
MNRAYLGDVVGYQKAAGDAWQLIQQNQFDHTEKACEALQGLTRGAVMLDMPDEAKRASEANRRLLKGMKEGGVSAPIRRLQRIRAELERVNRYEGKKNDRLLQAGGSAYQTAQKRYPRLAAQIHEALHS